MKPLAPMTQTVRPCPGASAASTVICGSLLRDGREGLSALAFFMMQTLRSLSRDGRTVIASVHQPRSEVFELFDHLYLLLGGKTVYFGQASQAYEFFAKAGFPCPSLRNPSDHFLSCINSDFDKVKATLKGSIKTRYERTDDPLEKITTSDAIRRLTEFYKRSQYNYAAQEKVDEISRVDSCEETTSTKVKGSTSTPEELDQALTNSSSCTNNVNEDSHHMSTQDDKATLDLKPDQDQSETEGSDQGKVLKKPDKILPCPRCNSMDTKFCYYNNYNVNQPRHFCKNCQRYWTVGGTMRNVPVGAGRRKNKHSASHYRQMVMQPDGIASSRIDALDLSQQALPCISDPTMPSKGNGTVLKFGTEAPLCESITSVLNLREQKRSSDCSPMTCGDNREEPSCVSSLAASNCVENGYANNTVQNEENSQQGFGNGATPMHNLQCYPGPPWPYTWGPSWKTPELCPGQSRLFNRSVWASSSLEKVISGVMADPRVTMGAAGARVAFLGYKIEPPNISGSIEESYSP